jgi:hypothetical protein
LGHYPSKSDFERKVRDFLRSAPDGPIEDPLFYREIQDLLYLHPRYEEKVGCGIDRIVVAANVEGSGSGFLILRIDGSSERFSYPKCISGKEPTRKSLAVEAFRFEVRDQISAYRSTVKLPVKCAISGQWIVHPSQLEIDHRVAFRDLLEAFRAEEGYFSWESVLTVGSGEDLRLADRARAARWWAFHKRTAELQPSLKRANAFKGARSQNSRERETTPARVQ